MVPRSISDCHQTRRKKMEFYRMNYGLVLKKDALFFIYQILSILDFCACKSLFKIISKHQVERKSPICIKSVRIEKLHYSSLSSKQQRRTEMKTNKNFLNTHI